MPTPTSFMNHPPLTLYPAIDLKGGECVRLRQGMMDDATRYNPDPAAQATTFKQAGCDWLHVVDLDGAFKGQSANVKAVQAILQAVAQGPQPMKVELGGGLRSLEAIESWLNAGVHRAILGSAAVKNPELVKEAAKRWPGRIVAGIDAKNGYVATEGWADVSTLPVLDLALKMQDAGVAAIIFTEISRDGMLEGLALKETAALAEALDVPIIASGGVGNAHDLLDLRRTAAKVKAYRHHRSGGIEGVIVGRALYDGRVTLAEAMSVLQGPSKVGTPC
ncbi:1-(5-phosphoribosyl)-5-[(5-phosphoribosylamino)methylideneamino]imidazole-4-carboxamide isomerase [Formicincola oecophyllae]|uniref:1-(5-phosphoribosyl)-5-[(5-phosphoribosylamino)methylideneamino] imidazole-4-carboxamide isomerase n=1 Tax=Formicincola oecophyllae TaxID=2558361 RepID=A0A4Y6UAX0_9PROT|nr:1-(5-phosphoribosyl)-5-[(5-phosphoribosylamino)methylideneamino]imidazole-4-carboxamide isomerase [Formicincola oecophyllae]